MTLIILNYKLILKMIIWIKNFNILKILYSLYNKNVLIIFYLQNLCFIWIFYLNPLFQNIKSFIIYLLNNIIVDKLWKTYSINRFSWHYYLVYWFQSLCNSNWLRCNILKRTNYVFSWIENKRLMIIYH